MRRGRSVRTEVGAGSDGVQESEGQVLLLAVLKVGEENAAVFV